MDTMQVIEIVAATVGILYVWLEMKASMWLWPVGIVLPLFYIYISWESQVYGNVLVNVYYVVASILGWIAWRKRRDTEDDTSHISHMPAGRTAISVIGIVALLTVVLVWAYNALIPSPFPFWDAFATAISFVGMWLLAKEWIETWICWIASNAIYSALYFTQGFTVTGWFFVVYTVIAVMGAIRWRRMMKETKA